MGKEKNKVSNTPDNIITVLFDPLRDDIDSSLKNTIFNLVKKPTKKRDWFSPHFYRCLPLTIGNQYGFVITNQFDFSFVWNGQDTRDSITFKFYEPMEEIDNKYFSVKSHFGHGIITISTPFILQTPAGVNLITINPPNHVIPNITVMTGVVEADNISMPFTFNLKIQIPNLEVFVPAGTPLAGFIPIPRYYQDSFSLKLAEDIFDEETLIKKEQAYADSSTHREEVEESLPNQVGRFYLNGVDVYGNRFKDHQIL